jgi:hypothetical protein
MYRHIHSRSRVHATPVSRRAVVAGSLLIVAAGWRPATSPDRRAAAHGSGTFPAELVPPQGPTYVGPTSDPETLVAIIVLEDRPGQAVAYLCRGAELNVWFTGIERDGMLALTGPDPSIGVTPEPGLTLTEQAPTLTGELTDGQITGEAVLFAGRTLRFTAVPAAGIAGLYVTERDEDGMVHGVSSTGASLQARQTVATGEAAATAPYRITGTVVTADGSHFEFAIPARTDVPAVFRWVALADGSVRGAGRRWRGAGDQFVGGSIDLNRSADGAGFTGSEIDLNQSDDDGFMGKTIEL